MKTLFTLQKVAFVNFRRWKDTPNIWITFIMFALFSIANISGVLEYSKAVAVRVSPWVWPHFFLNNLMPAVFGTFCIFLFSEAPFRDRFSQFLEVRCGRGLWIWGQMLYILEAAVAEVLAFVLITILVCLPRAFFGLKWGVLLQDLAINPGRPAEFGIEIIGFNVSSVIVSHQTPLSAMAVSMLIGILVAAFLGAVIFFFNTVLWEGAGVVAAGALCIFSFFTMVVGRLFFGPDLLYFSPVNWVNIAALDPREPGPGFAYALWFLILGTAVLMTLGVKRYLSRES